MRMHTNSDIRLANVTLIELEACPTLEKVKRQVQRSVTQLVAACPIARMHMSYAACVKLAVPPPCL